MLWGCIVIGLRGDRCIGLWIVREGCAGGGGGGGGTTLAAVGITKCCLYMSPIKRLISSTDRVSRMIKFLASSRVAILDSFLTDGPCAYGIT